MTWETLSEPLERRLLGDLERTLGVVGAGAAVVFWWALLAERFEVAGPLEVYQGWKERRADRRRYREAMLATLDDIDALPELDDELELDEQELDEA